MIQFKLGETGSAFFFEIFKLLGFHSHGGTFSFVDSSVIQYLFLTLVGGMLIEIMVSSP